ncbi:U1 small nuclear ribonucleoprotein C-like [Cheilinus undulatus]|uniref:U1 small nuclear ribonucleoprotein C-like n=1 Tax=Cheilinus undulatus TaxID=241271 RepID=UPI001BD4C469|nr:U1 small nuclear ribonucleoprotein C-like [Cheilinus undulatus]
MPEKQTTDPTPTPSPPEPVPLRNAYSMFIPPNFKNQSQKNLQSPQISLVPNPGVPGYPPFPNPGVPGHPPFPNPGVPGHPPFPNPGVPGHPPFPNPGVPGPLPPRPQGDFESTEETTKSKLNKLFGDAFSKMKRKSKNHTRR